MTALAIVGAGPGLGMAAARRFAAEGFAVGLVARDRERVEGLAADLGADGVRAAGFAADVHDRTALSAALDRIATELGPVEVVQFSPLPAPQFLRAVLDTPPEVFTEAVDFSLGATVATVHRLLPGLRKLGRGTILLVNGGSAVEPKGAVAGTSVAFAAQAVYAQLLHEALAPERINVAQLVVPGRIVAGDPDTDPDVLAEHLWQLHARRDRFRFRVGP